jgi:hypothetical protein
VVVDEEAVRSFSLVTPATSKEVLIAALFNVANPVAACCKEVAPWCFEAVILAAQ